MKQHLGDHPSWISAFDSYLRENQAFYKNASKKNNCKVYQLSSNVENRFQLHLKNTPASWLKKVIKILNKVQSQLAVGVYSCHYQILKDFSYMNDIMLMFWVVKPRSNYSCNFFEQHLRLSSPSFGHFCRKLKLVKFKYKKCKKKYLCINCMPFQVFCIITS